MIDLHTHTFFSDGELLPSELIRRAFQTGYRALAVTDHMDASNMDLAIPRVVAAIDAVAPFTDMTIIPGAEITHVPPEVIGRLVAKARMLGAKIVLVHGETVVEPVAKGTNRAAIEAGADIISHPGLITREDAERAREKGVALEITSRRGHSLSNGHVARTALEVGANLVINTDAHGPGDLITREYAEVVLQAAGIPKEIIGGIFENSRTLVEKFS